LVDAVDKRASLCAQLQLLAHHGHQLAEPESVQELEQAENGNAWKGEWGSEFWAWKGEWAWLDCMPTMHTTTGRVSCILHGCT
jgi:hypothetical protein